MLTTTKDSFYLGMNSLNDAMKYCEMLSRSDVVPKAYKDKPEDIFVCLQYGVSVGLKPMQALHSIAVINGRACMWGDALLALILSHPDFEDISEFQSEDVATCIIKRKRKGRIAEIKSEFSIEDAKRARLWGKQGPWTQYPDRMLKMRARSFADALYGIITTEEAQDIPYIKEAQDIKQINSDEKISKIDYIKNKILAEEVEEKDLKMEFLVKIPRIIEQNGSPPELGYVIEEPTNELQNELIQPRTDHTYALQNELMHLIDEFDVKESVYKPWLKKAGAKSLFELNNEQTQKCIDYINDMDKDKGK